MLSHFAPAVARPRLRVATVDDVLALHPMINRAFAHERWLIPGLRISVPEVLSEVVAEENTFVVAEDGGQLVGCARFQPSGSPDSALPMLGLIAVDIAAQGRGIGAQMMRKLEGVARASGFEHVHLQCGLELGTSTYYARLGYEVVGRELGRRWSSTKPFVLLTMRKKVARSR